MNVRARRRTLTGAGMAALTGAAVLLAPGVAAGAPAHPIDQPAVSTQQAGAGHAMTNGTATNGTATNGTATNGTATNGTATNNSVQLGRALWNALPQNLRQDLANAALAPANQRQERLQHIAQTALNGGYGTQIRSGAQQVQGFLQNLPQNLRSDLWSVAGQQPQQARQHLQRIYRSARDGQYGQQVQTWAQRVQQTLQTWHLGPMMHGTPD